MNSAADYTICNLDSNTYSSNYHQQHHHHHGAPLQPPAPPIIPPPAASNVPGNTAAYAVFSPDVGDYSSLPVRGHIADTAARGGYETYRLHDQDAGGAGNCAGVLNQPPPAHHYQHYYQQQYNNLAAYSAASSPPAAATSGSSTSSARGHSCYSTSGAQNSVAPLLNANGEAQFPSPLETGVATYKWMTVKRNAPKTGTFSCIFSFLRKYRDI